MNKRKMLNKALTENFRATHSSQLESKNLEDVKKGELIYVTNGMYDVCIGEYLGDYHQVMINSGTPGKRYYEYEFEVRVVLPLDDRYKEGSLTNGYASYPDGYVSVFTGSLENESLEEASYGGAFDIEDNQFFTRDDLNELMDDINDRCRTQFPERGMEAIEAYMSEDGKTLEVVMEDADYGEESVFIPIDMRSIRKPSDLLKYSNRVIKEFIRQADNFNAYYDHVNSFYGEKLDEALGEGPADFIVPVYTVDEEVELKDKLAEVEVTLGELYGEYGKDRIDYLLKRANYASYVREHRLGYALENLISTFAIKKFREANPEYASEILSNDRPIILNGNLVDSGVEELGKVLGKKLLPHLGEELEDDKIKIGDMTFFLSSRYTYKDGTMFYHSQGYPEGRPEKKRPYRVSPKYNMYVDSFRGRAYPTSTVYIADKESGKVYEGEVDLVVGARGDYAKIVEWMRNGGHLDPKPKSEINHFGSLL